MKRRQFIAGLGSAAAWPLAARAQQPAIPVVGFLMPQSAEDNYKNLTVPFLQGLRESGYVEGQNVTIEYRFSDAYDRLRELADELVRRRVAVIATSGLEAALAAKAATTTIPIVFRTGGDPVQYGLVASFNRPGGNISGINDIGEDLGPKRLGLLHDLLPGASRFAMLVDPRVSTAKSATTDLRAAAAAIGRPIEVVTASTNSEIDAAFASLVQKRIDALLVLPHVLFAIRRLQLTTLATYHRLPAIYGERMWVEVGGLMSYGTDFRDVLRQTGIYTGRILKGEKPADLPVMQPTKFELVINLKTAKALGLTIPETLLATADEVIQ
jgi:putative tryptophan/tyrosine transport system substrate-binding protein